MNAIVWLCHIDKQWALFCGLLSLSSETYDQLIRAFAERGDLNGVVRTMQMMEENKISNDDFTYNNLILAFGTKRYVRNIIESRLFAPNFTHFLAFRFSHMIPKIVDVMRLKGYKVRKETLIAMLKAYARTGSIENINCTFDRFDDFKISLSNKDVLDVIFELYVSNHIELIDDVAHRLHKSPEFATSLTSFVNRAIRRKEDSVVYKLLAIFDEDNRITLYKLYVEAYKKQPSALDGAGSADFIEKSIIWEILRDMKTKSMPIDGKYFWKLIQLERANGPDAVLNLVHSVRKEFNVVLDVSTIRDVILPCINIAADPFLAFARMRTVESNQLKIFLSVIERCLMDGNMQAASEIVIHFKKLPFDVIYLQNSLIDAVLANKDVFSFARVIRALQISLRNYRDPSRQQHPVSKREHSDCEPKSDPRPTTSIEQEIFTGNVLCETIARSQSNPELIRDVLRKARFVRLKISPQIADKIRTSLGRDFIEGGGDDHIDQILEDLIHGESDPDFHHLKTKKDHVLSAMNSLSSSELQRILESGEHTSELKKMLLNAYFREGNVAKFYELVKTGTISNCDLNESIKLIIKYNRQQANDYMKNIRGLCPNFELSLENAIRLANIMFKVNHEWSDIIRTFTENNLKDFGSYDQKCCLNFVKVVAKTGNAAQLVELYHILVEKHFLMLQIGKRFDLFFDRLIKVVISVNDMEKLKCIFDILESERSKCDALMALSRNLILMGEIQQAKIIFFHSPPDDITLRKYVKYFREHGGLEGLLDVTEGMQIDRTYIYDCLVHHYFVFGKTYEVLQLRRRQRRNGEQPSETFISYMEELLEEEA